MKASNEFCLAIGEELTKIPEYPCNIFFCIILLVQPYIISADNYKINILNISKTDEGSVYPAVSNIKVSTRS